MRHAPAGDRGTGCGRRDTSASGIRAGPGEGSAVFRASTGVATPPPGSQRRAASSIGRPALVLVAKICAVTLFVNAFVERPLHEFGHYWAATLLGAPAYVDDHRLVWATGRALVSPDLELMLVAGGLFAGSLLLVLALCMRRPYQIGLLPLVAGEFAYAPLDGTAIGNALGLLVFGAAFSLCVGAALVRCLTPERESHLPPAGTRFSAGPHRGPPLRGGGNIPVRGGHVAWLLRRIERSPSAR